MNSEQARILVIDDEEIVHASVGKILRRAGYSTESVFSAADGLERARQDEYDLIITDLMMPGMNGIELLRALRAAEVNAAMLMITGYPTIRTALEAMRLGAMDYLAKPFTRKELLAPVMRALRQEPEEAPAEMSEDGSVVDPANLVPGTELFLPHHAWARFQQDGYFKIGVEASFLGAAGQVTSLDLPEPLDLLEQGRTGLQMATSAGEEHAVAMPLSGQVVDVNEALDPGDLTSDRWCLRLLPSDLKAELRNLMVRRTPAG